ncbi:hypothetical protein C8N24_0345 [Solirubrobacter pauli]|uniref:Uncharacterized protein n=1 Tax=Solirubrobacter pauli TaxID=166793 RepID=A0A660L7R4_9ACTN|nr:hypothetical protein [Solirubrobacter pauli]RKQ90539.1 hypothetical protein C8N24_0345 [Solirubrobacter pauli]
MSDVREAESDDDNDAISLFIYLVVFLTSSGISSAYGLGLWASLALGLAISAGGALAHRRWVTRRAGRRSFGNS